MLIYNTLTRQKEEFVPREPGKVSMYVCGVTVYDYCHLGHARSFMTFDMIYRTLLYFGFDVKFVKNFTDIDDKIIVRSNERKIPFTELTEEFIQAYREDTAALGLKTPNLEPKATEHIAEMIRMIEILESKGLAYRVESDVFYAVRKFEGYGKLSGKNIEDLEAGARVDVLESKKDPLDFALWKGSKPGEPSWKSPWGEGRPGWHIECSAMSTKYLGETFDIHGGGRDLIFPHHENEVAQTEGCTGKNFARYWIHNGFVNINTEKMSKSLGNTLRIRDLLTIYPAEVLKMFVFAAHYRSPLDYTEQNMAQALAAMERYYETLLRLKTGNVATAASGDVTFAKMVAALKPDFDAAMGDDFNTAKVVGSVFELVREINKALDEKRILGEHDLKLFWEHAQRLGDVLGTFGSDPKKFLQELRSKGAVRSGVDAAEIESLIEERKAARAAKNFKRSDEIRDLLKAKGIVLKDSPDGKTVWTISTN